MMMPGHFDFSVAYKCFRKWCASGRAFSAKIRFAMFRAIRRQRFVLTWITIQTEFN